MSNDMILAILVRLPVKSLVRFRSVSKSWRTSISSSDFVMRHCSRQNEGNNTHNSLSILYSTDPLECVDYEILLSHKKGDSPVASRVLPLDSPREYITIVGSCNGLICLLEWPSCFFLWNPSTRDTNKLPILETCDEDIFYGFGYDSTNQDYKIACGSTSAVSGSTSSHRTTKIAIFTLKSGSWRTRTIEDPNFAEFSGHGCLSNRILHWVEYPHAGAISFVNLAARIILFDLQTEKFQKMVQVSGIINAQWVRKIAIQTTGDSIYLTYENVSGSMFTVLKIKEYKVEQSWDLEIERDRDLWIPKVMCMLEKGGVLVRFLVTLKHKDLVLYDPKEKKCRIVLESSHRFDYQVESPVMFRETLISPTTGCGAECP